MDRKLLIKNLNHLFCAMNKKGRKYAEVWLSDVNFGEIYQPEKYILNVKAEHDIDNCKMEIMDILQTLDTNAHEELQYIWSVSIYDSNDTIHCVSDDLLVYSESTSC